MKETKEAIEKFEVFQAGRSIFYTGFYSKITDEYGDIWAQIKTLKKEIYWYRPEQVKMRWKNPTLSQLELNEFCDKKS